ncbi:MAG: hypothetical protein R3B07_23350 [Polyangiaceae bacterium]
MGYSVMAYTIGVERLRRLFSQPEARAARTLRYVTRSGRGSIQSTNNNFEDEIAEGCPPIELALEQLLFGKPQHPDHAYMYGYALELICDAYGSFLNNHDWSGMPRSSYLETVAEALDPTGSDAVRQLLYRGSPARAVPKAYEWPCIGYLEESEISGELARLTPEVMSALEDSSVRDTANRLRSWLELADDRGTGIVAFLY